MVLKTNEKNKKKHCKKKSKQTKKKKNHKTMCIEYSLQTKLNNHKNQSFNTNLKLPSKSNKKKIIKITNKQKSYSTLTLQF